MTTEAAPAAARALELSRDILSTLDTLPESHRYVVLTTVATAVLCGIDDSALRGALGRAHLAAVTATLRRRALLDQPQGHA